MPEATADPRFENISAKLHDHAAAHPGFSAQLSIRIGDDLVLDDVAGAGLDVDSMTGVYSVSKGVAALVIAQLVHDGALELDRAVVDYWPEFGANGKTAITVRQVLSHRAGLPLAARTLAIRELSDAGAAAVLAEQRPLWAPGSAFGYHALTIGILMEELVRRSAGTTLQRFFETQIREPLGADFYLGLPADLDHRYRWVADPRLNPTQAAEVASRPPVDDLAAAVFSNTDAPDDRSPQGVSTNNVEIRRRGPAAIGGVGNTRGLSLLYAATLPGTRRPIANPEVFADMAQQQSWGIDRVLNVANCFGTVFMLPQPRMPFGSVGAYGHDGAGGALAFADPATGVAFAYIPSPMQYPGGADPLSIALARDAMLIARAA
ncbi:UNVERIFIED_CONTAM: beta-lactamase family protein [Microbacterium sp. SLM126]